MNTGFWLRMSSISLRFSSVILVAYILSQVTCVQRSNVGMFTDANADKIVFLNFVSYFDSVLNVSAIVSKFTSSTEDCQFLCMTTLNCLSVNVAIGSDLSEGRHLCQLLNTTKNSKRDDDFKPSDTFHHFTTIVSILQLWIFFLRFLSSFATDDNGLK